MGTRERMLLALSSVRSDSLVVFVLNPMRAARRVVRRTEGSLASWNSSDTMSSFVCSVGMLRVARRTQLACWTFWEAVMEKLNSLFRV